MSITTPVLSLPPAVTIHLALALAALALGPLALRARKGSRLHRGAGFMWVGAMVGTAVSSLFIRDFDGFNIGGYTVIHGLVLVTVVGLARGLRAIAQGRIAAHRKAMWQTYFGACIGAGVFTLLPDRYLGQLVWHQTLGWI